MTAADDRNPDDATRFDPRRRMVLKAGAGLVVAFAYGALAPAAHAFSSARRQPGDAEAALADGNPEFAPNSFIRIDKRGRIRLVLPQVEMGQGIYTGQATLIAEELGVDLDQVELQHAPANVALYGLAARKSQSTGGSASIASCWGQLREAGAVARTLLVAAAAQRWDVAPASCTVARGRVTHPASQRSAGFGELAALAGTLPMPDTVELTGPANYRLIGRTRGRMDTRAKVTGQPLFGHDVVVPGMRQAALVLAPTLGGRVKAVRDARAARMPGVQKIVTLDDCVAVIADHFWHARQAADALEIDWDAGPNAGLSTATITAGLEAAARTGTALVAKAAGSMDDPAGRRVGAVYRLPMMSHAPLEPLSAVASVTTDRCELWLGTQRAEEAAQAAAQASGLPRERVALHNQYLGGAFGRRLASDFVARAVRVAARCPFPVKVIWTREQDMRGDRYWPPFHHHLTATLKADGTPATWHHRVVSESVWFRAEKSPPPGGIDLDAVDGAVDPWYALPNRRVEHTRVPLPDALGVGWMRGTGVGSNTFAIESFVDELAHGAQADPVEFRRRLLGESPRALAVLNLAAQKYGWTTRPAGARRGRGVAVCAHNGVTWLAVIVEVEIDAAGAVRLRRAVAAVDCGTVVNPDVLVAQVQGGLIFGWSSALHGRITVKDGAIEQGNFTDYAILKIDEAPPIEVHLVPSTEPPGGIGEPPTMIAPVALTNAIFDAVGVRVRDLPIDPAALATPRATAS